MLSMMYPAGVLAAILGHVDRKAANMPLDFKTQTIRSQEGLYHVGLSLDTTAVKVTFEPSAEERRVLEQRLDLKQREFDALAPQAGSRSKESQPEEEREAHDERVRAAIARQAELRAEIAETTARLQQLGQSLQWEYLISDLLQVGAWQAGPAGGASLPVQVRGEGWVISRFEGEDEEYLATSIAADGDDEPWSMVPDHALRFADRSSAEAVREVLFGEREDAQVRLLEWGQEEEEDEDLGVVDQVFASDGAATASRVMAALVCGDPLPEDLSLVESLFLSGVEWLRERPWLVQTSAPATFVEAVARVCHEVNRAYCAALGDESQLPWEEAPGWQRESAIKGVEFNLLNPDAPASASHDSWLAVKEAEGWKYGPVKDPDIKEHPCCVPYDQLPVEQQAKDHIFKAVVRALATTAVRGEGAEADIAESVAASIARRLGEKIDSDLYKMSGISSAESDDVEPGGHILDRGQESPCNELGLSAPEDFEEVDAAMAASDPDPLKAEPVLIVDGALFGEVPLDQLAKVKKPQLEVLCRRVAEAKGSVTDPLIGRETRADLLIWLRGELGVAG